MDSFQSVLGDAAGGALCNVLGTYGSAAPLLTAISLIEPTPVGEALAVSAGLAGLAANVGCAWDPNGTPPPSLPGPYTGCKKFSKGSGELYWKHSNGNEMFESGNYIVEMLEFNGPYQHPTVSDWTQIYFKWINTSGTTKEKTLNFSYVPTSFEVRPSGNAVCEEQAPTGPMPDPAPHTHTDPASGCEINVNFQGWALGPAGDVGGVWLMEPAAPQTRNSGGVIGGCNFAPTIYYDGGGGGGGGGPVSFPVPDPVPPDGDEPWWAPLLRGAAGGAAAAIVNKALEDLFETPYPAGSYEIKGVCERDPDGNPMDVTRSSTYTSAPGIDAVLTRLDALADLFQYHKELRQPICRPPRGGGDLVTVNFVSDAPSPQGRVALRKYLRYRDQTNTDLAVHGAHWSDFSWQAGSVVVGHENGAWGQVQVWAVSADEGKRVIRHAGAVAGVDPDSDGDWVITSSSDPRYGQPGTMRVEVRAIGEQGEKYIRVTKRSDPNGVPLLAAA